MEKMIKITALICSVVFLVNCDLTGGCINTISTEVKSPDGMRVTTIFERDCGATTNFVTYVNLRSHGKDFDPNEGVVFGVDGSKDIEIDWIDDASFKLKCKSCLPNEIMKKETVSNGIRIIY